MHLPSGAPEIAMENPTFFIDVASKIPQNDTPLVQQNPQIPKIPY